MGNRLQDESNVPKLIAGNDLPITRENSPKSKNIGTVSKEPQLSFKTPDSRHTRNRNGSLVRSSTISSGSKSPVRGHLRSFSGASCNSTLSRSNSVRKGINLGLNVIGTSSLNDTTRDKEHTPRRQLFTTPLKQEGFTSISLSQYKSDSEPGARSSIETNNSDVSSIINSPTPSIPKSQAEENKIEDPLSDKFRLLASKEMELLEIKNQLNDLLKRKRESENDLKRLKLSIEKQLLRNLKQQNNEQSRHRIDQNIPKSPTSIHKRVMKPSSSTNDPLINYSGVDSSVQTNTNDTTLNDKYDKRQSWFSKPLSLFQQFDNLITKEFEKLQIPDEENEDLKLIDMNYNVNDKAADRDAQYSAPIRSLVSDTASSSADVMQSVSQHIWSFVNDVKSNLLIEEEPEYELPITSSPIKDESPGNDNPKVRIRTASISKRRSYSQHIQHKKRPSMNIVNDHIEVDKNAAKEVIRSISRNGNSEPEINDDKNTKELTTPEIEKNSLGDSIDESELWDNELLDI